jgi:hypothetical protein
LPCPTVILTIGLLLTASGGIPLSLAVIPIRGGSSVGPPRHSWRSPPTTSCSRPAFYLCSQWQCNGSVRAGWRIEQEFAT